MKNLAESMPAPDANEPQEEQEALRDEAVALIREGMELPTTKELKNPVEDDEDVQSLLKGIKELDDLKETGQSEDKEDLSKVNLHEHVARSAAKVANAIVAERIGEATIVTMDPTPKAYGMFKAAVEAVREQVRAPSLEGDDAVPEKKEVAKLVDDFIRQEVRSAFHAALRQELDQSTLERERVGIQKVMEVIDRIGS